jgi:hypothetical protein
VASGADGAAARGDGDETAVRAAAHQGRPDLVVLDPVGRPVGDLGVAGTDVDDLLGENAGEAAGTEVVTGEPPEIAHVHRTGVVDADPDTVVELIDRDSGGERRYARRRPRRLPVLGRRTEEGGEDGRIGGRGWHSPRSGVSSIAEKTVTMPENW